MRIALGATAAQVVGHFVGESLTVTAMGALLGWSLALLVAMDFARGGRVDVPVFTIVPVILMSVAALACWVPARRAARVDAAVALRNE